MSHLGDQLSALVDGELDGAERDRAHAHLASCEQCRAEAATITTTNALLINLPRSADVSRHYRLSVQIAFLLGVTFKKTSRFCMNGLLGEESDSR